MIYFCLAFFLVLHTYANLASLAGHCFLDACYIFLDFSLFVECSTASCYIYNMDLNHSQALPTGLLSESTAGILELPEISMIRNELVDMDAQVANQSTGGNNLFIVTKRPRKRVSESSAGESIIPSTERYNLSRSSLDNLTKVKSLIQKN